MKTFSLASFNIGASAKMYGRYDETDLFAIADLIKHCGADVVALQEVDRRFGSRESALSASYVAANSEYKAIDFSQYNKSIIKIDAVEANLTEMINDFKTKKKVKNMLVNMLG